MKILILHGLLTALSIIPAYAQSVVEKVSAEKSGATSVLGIRTRRIETSLSGSTAKTFSTLPVRVQTMQRAGAAGR